MLIERISRSIGEMRVDFARQLSEINTKVDKINDANEKKYLTQAEFTPWKWAIMLMVGGILTAAIAGLMASIIGP